MGRVDSKEGIMQTLGCVGGMIGLICLFIGTVIFFSTILILITAMWETSLALRLITYGGALMIIGIAIFVVSLSSAGEK